MQQFGTEGVQGSTRQGGQGDPLGNVQEIEIWPYEQVAYAQPRTRSGEWDTQSSLEIWELDGQTKW